MHEQKLRWAKAQVETPHEYWCHNVSASGAIAFILWCDSAMMWNIMTPGSAQGDRGLVVFGEFFLDLVFYDLPKVPRLGAIVRAIF